MVNIKKYNFFLFIFSMLFTLYAQTAFPQEPNEISNIQIMNVKPNIITQSPDVAAMEKFGNYKVGYFNGLPDISFPIFEIKAGNIFVPITLKYHASGIKVSEYASSVGLGWAIFAGGYITRNVKGHADNGETYVPLGISKTYNINTPKSENYITTLFNNYGSASLKNYFDYNDLEPDIYDYNLPAGSGKFLYFNNDSIIEIPKNRNVIKKTNYNGVPTFEMKDNLGIQYLLNVGEVDRMITNEYFYEGLLGPETQESYLMNTFRLSKIIDSNNNQEVNFTYIHHQNSLTSQTLSGSVDIEDFYGGLINTAQGRVFRYDPVKYMNHLTISSIENQRFLERIDFINGKVEFSYLNRTDIDSKLLSEINIYNKVNGVYSVIKKVVFNYTYEYSDDNTCSRLFLKSIKIGEGENSFEEYFFDYNNTKLPKYNSTATDYWGYFNNHINGYYFNDHFIPFLIPSFTTSIVQAYNSEVTEIHETTLGGANRNPDTFYSQAGMLKQITYPTKGYSIFEYENNKFLDQDTIRNIGSLRIKSIKNFDYDNTLIYNKIYLYGTNENTVGIKNFLTRFELENFYDKMNEVLNYIYTPRTDFTYDETIIRKKNYTINNFIYSEAWDAAQIFYDEVSEYTLDRNNGRNLKSTFFYSVRPDIYSPEFSPYKPIFTSQHLFRGQLLKKIDYIKTNNQFYETQKIENFYNFNEYNRKDGLVVQFSTIRTYSWYPVAYNETYIYSPQNFYIYKTTPIYNLNPVINKTVQTIFDQNNLSNNLTNIKTYSYDNNYLLLRKVTEYLNGTDSLITTYTYPFDYPNQPIYNLMKIKNMLNYKIESSQQKNTTQLAKINVEYNYTQNFIKPTLYKTSFNNSNPIVDFEIVQYDYYGNIISIKNKDNTFTTYKYGYYNSVPFTKVEHAQNNEFFHENFEEYNNNTTSLAHTGFKAASNGFNLTFVIPNNRKYILQYFKNENNQWNFYREPYTGTKTLAGIIDDVSIFPEDATLFSYTYFPLIGLSSEIKPNGITSYFEYDALNRLVFIKDNNKNIIKSYEYNYK